MRIAKNRGIRKYLKRKASIPILEGWEIYRHLTKPNSKHTDSNSPSTVPLLALHPILSHAV